MVFQGLGFGCLWRAFVMRPNPQMCVPASCPRVPPSLAGRCRTARPVPLSLGGIVSNSSGSASVASWLQRWRLLWIGGAFHQIRMVPERGACMSGRRLTHTLADAPKSVWRVWHFRQVPYTLDAPAGTVARTDGMQSFSREASWPAAT